MKIALIAPSDKSSSIEEDAKKVRELGFEPVYLEGTVSDEFPYRGTKIANTPEERARQIINFSQDPEVAAMWALSGGSSSPEVCKLLVEYGENPEQYIETHQRDPLSGKDLEYHAEATNGFPKNRPLPAIVGMSDVSNVQIALARFGFPSHYGAGIGQKSEHLPAMANSINGQSQTLRGVTLLSENRDTTEIKGSVYATVGGGLGSSLETSWQFQALPGTVLVLEDVAGYESLNRELLRAKKVGALENVSAIVIGNAVGKANPEGYVPNELRELAARPEFRDINIMFANNQVGHIFTSSTTSTPISNFGEITIDLTSGEAAIDPTPMAENVLSYSRQYSSKKTGSLLTGENPPELETSGFSPLKLHPENAAAKKYEGEELTNIVGGDSEELRLGGYPNLSEKTLVLSWGSFGLGRELPDLYNARKLQGVGAIVLAINNHHARLENQVAKPYARKEDKIAAGLSLISHPAFEFAPGEEENIFFCSFANKSFAEDVQASGGLAKFAEERAEQFRWHFGNIKMEGATAELDGERVKLTIPKQHHQQLIEKAEKILDPLSSESQRVKEQENRVKNFVRRYLTPDDSGKNQAGDFVDNIPVFSTNIDELPDEIRKGRFSAEKMTVELQGKEKKGKWVERIKALKKQSETKTKEHA